MTTTHIEGHWQRNGPEVLAFVWIGAFALFLIAALWWRVHGRREALEAFARAKRLATREDLDGAISLVKEALRSLPSGRRGHPTKDGVEMATTLAIWEERRRQELKDRRAKLAVREEREAAGAAPAPVAATPSLDPRALRPGLQVGEYRLESAIGEGGSSVVWRARHRAFDTPAALKIPRGPGHVAGLRRMCKLQRGLEDPRIVRVLGADLEADTPHVALELVEGTDLRRRLRSEKRIPPEEALALFAEVLRALAAAHRAGVVHRDLKPENILLAEGGAVKVTDFDLGQVGRAPEGGSRDGAASKEGATGAVHLSTGLESVAHEGAAVGTLAYMAPEQLAGEAVDARADVYALGVLLFEMLTGERPQPSDVPSRFVPGLPASVDALFEGCYTRKERRFANAGAVLAALEANSLRAAAPPSGPASEASPRGGGHAPAAALDLAPGRRSG